MITHIESSNSNIIKQIKRLGYKKHRDDDGKIVVEGSNLITEALNRSIRPDFILVSEEYDSGFISQSDVAWECPLYIAKKSIFDSVSDAKNGSGVLAVISIAEILEHTGTICMGDDDNLLILDRLQDPGNLGTIIRTAVAAGYKKILAVKGTADVYSPKVLRATAGMIFDVSFEYRESYDEILSDIAGKKLAVSVPSGGIAYYEAGLGKNTALVIGNEGNGASDKLIDAADILVTIPMASGAESLNAAVAAALLMYESVRTSSH